MRKRDRKGEREKKYVFTEDGNNLLSAVRHAHPSSHNVLVAPFLAARAPGNGEGRQRWRKPR